MSFSALIVQPCGAFAAISCNSYRMSVFDWWHEEMLLTFIIRLLPAMVAGVWFGWRTVPVADAG